MKKYKILSDCRDMYEEDIIDTILEQRGIKDKDHFLNPTPNDMFPLDKLNNIHKAYEIYKNAADNELSIGVLFDTDCDGVSSGTIITRYTREVQNSPCDTFINQGKAHGLKNQDLERFKDLDLLIIVDSLDSDIECYKKLKNEYNVKEIIVLDHHDINPNIDYNSVVTLVSSQDNYPNPALSGSGVVFKFICYVEEQDSIDITDAEQYADLAACGILADVCSVAEESYENRYIVNLGLNNLRNPGLKKILGSYEFNSKAVLFSIAPLINASNRVGENESAMKLFLADDNKEVLKYKKILENCKVIQNEEKEVWLDNVREQFSKQDSEVLFAITNPKYGINGLMGNTLLEEYNKPVVIVTEIDDTYTGSLRSQGYGNFSKLCNETGFAACNGHPEAAGITINKDNYEKFQKAISNKLNGLEKTTIDDIIVDAQVNLTDITRKLADLVKIVNKISGDGFKPITFNVSGIDSYGISSWKQGQHLLINTDTVTFIQWNTDVNYDEMEEHSLLGDEITANFEIESGFVGRQYMIKGIMSDYKIND